MLKLASNYVDKDDLELGDLPASTFQALGFTHVGHLLTGLILFSFLSSEKGSISVAQAALEISVLRLSLLNARIIDMCYCAKSYGVLYGII